MKAFEKETKELEQKKKSCLTALDLNDSLIDVIRVFATSFRSCQKQSSNMESQK